MVHFLNGMMRSGRINIDFKMNSCHVTQQHTNGAPKSFAGLILYVYSSSIGSITSKNISPPIISAVDIPSFGNKVFTTKER